MKTILKVFASVLAVALIVLLVFSYLEKGQEEQPFTDILGEVKDAGRQAGESLDDFLDESGIKEGAADLLEKGADMIRGEGGSSGRQASPGEEAPPAPNQESDRDWV